MPNLTVAGRTLFAIAIIGLGAEHFIFGEFVTGRAPPWPEAVPGGLPWAYLTGVVFAAAGLGLLTGWDRRASGLPAATLMLAGTLILVWAVLRHIPVVATDSLLAPSWTPAGKALTFWSGAWAVAATLPLAKQAGGSVVARFASLERPVLALTRVCLGAFFIVTGIQHYLYTEFVASLIPDWFPGSAVFWTYAAGVALIAAGVGLQVPRVARLAALLSGLMVFSWFWIVHLPRTFLNMSSAIAVFEALAVSGIAFVLAGYRAGEAGIEGGEGRAAGRRYRTITTAFM